MVLPIAHYFVCTYKIVALHSQHEKKRAALVPSEKAKNPASGWAYAQHGKQRCVKPEARQCRQLYSYIAIAHCLPQNNEHSPNSHSRVIEKS